MAYRMSSLNIVVYLFEREGRRLGTIIVPDNVIDRTDRIFAVSGAGVSDATSALARGIFLASLYDLELVVEGDLALMPQASHPHPTEMIH